MSAPIYVRDLREFFLIDIVDTHGHVRRLRELVPRPPDIVPEGGLLPRVIGYTASRFSRFLVMPNVPAIDTAADLVQYWLDIASVNEWQSQPLMTFKIGPNTTPEEVERCAKAGAVAGKLYPAGVTTGSEGGVQDFMALWPVLAAMEAWDLVLCLHGAMPGVFILDSEVAIHQIVEQIIKAFPRLRIVFEHMSDRRTVEFVDRHARAGARIAGGITAHHLVHTLHDVVGGVKLPVHLVCQPIYLRPEDKEALLTAALSGLPWFFFGSDTAPHRLRDKECAHASCGVFSAPIALEVVVQIFDMGGGTLGALRAFLAENAKRFYGLTDLPGHVIRLQRSEWSFNPAPVLGLTGVVPWCPWDKLTWRVTQEIPLIS
jgi:dihydroorotase